VYGILTPVVNGKRFFMNAHSNERFPMEAAEYDADILTVGRFIFSKAGFEKAIQVIRDAVDKKGWLVIDEIGPIELRGEGFRDILKEILAIRKEKIVLIVRQGLVEKVKEQFIIQEAEIITDISVIKKLS
jgi:nucleoside-triphosphatase THEP1